MPCTDTVAALIPDAQTRKMVVMLGLCLLPSISGSSGSNDQDADEQLADLKTMESFFFFLASSESSGTRKNAEQVH